MHEPRAACAANLRCARESTLSRVCARAPLLLATQAVAAAVGEGVFQQSKTAPWTANIVVRPPALRAAAPAFVAALSLCARMRSRSRAAAARRRACSSASPRSTSRSNTSVRHRTQRCRCGCSAGARMHAFQLARV
jgi:hypothetical protein